MRIQLNSDEGHAAATSSTATHHSFTLTTHLTQPYTTKFEPDDAQTVPQQPLSAEPMALDAPYDLFPAVGPASWTSKPLPSAGLTLAPSWSAGAGRNPSSASSTAPSGSSRASPAKPTGFDSLDSLGLLDGLISPRGGGGFFGGAPGAIAMVPEVLSCSSTPSQSPTFESPQSPATWMGAPRSARDHSPAPAGVAPIVTDASATAAVPPPLSSATRRSKRMHHPVSAAKAASARKSAASPVAAAPRPRAPRASRPASKAKGPKAKAVRKATAKKASRATKVGKKAKGAVSTGAAAAVLSASLAAHDRTGALPADHKPARGRGRQLQLAKMSPAQRAAEAKARLEKNRQAARGFRSRRKNHIQTLEAQVQGYEQRELEQQEAISSLTGEIEALRRLLQQQQSLRR